MKKLEIRAESLEEAKLKAYDQDVVVLFDATKAWNNCGKPYLSKELEIFAADFMNRKSMFGTLNSGIIISIKPSIQNKKKNPFKLFNSIRHGRIKLKREIQIRKKSDNTVVGTAYKKNEAKALAKEIIRDLKEDLYAINVYRPEDHEFELEYRPAWNARPGQYVIFSVDETDIRLHKNKRIGLPDKA